MDPVTAAVGEGSFAKHLCAQVVKFGSEAMGEKTSSDTQPLIRRRHIVRGPAWQGFCTF